MTGPGHAVAVAGVLVAALASSALGQTFEVTWHAVAGGGRTSQAAGGYELSGTIGQPGAGSMSGGGYSVSGGFQVVLPESTATGACCLAGACSEVEAAMCAGFVCDVGLLLPESFLGCYGDLDGNGVVNAGDRGFVSVNIGLVDPLLVCRYDLDGNGVINAADRGFVASNIGLCTPLPEWQNGSGLNDGEPDFRFPAAEFLGAGTSCAEVGCP